MRSSEREQHPAPAAAAPRRSRRVLASYARCRACRRVVLPRADGGEGEVLARERLVISGAGSVRARWRSVAYHPGCFEASVLAHRRRAHRILWWMGAAAVSAAAGAWWAGESVLAAALLWALGAYAARLQALDLVQVRSPSSAPGTAHEDEHIPSL